MEEERRKGEGWAKDVGKLKENYNLRTSRRGGGGGVVGDKLGRWEEEGRRVRKCLRVMEILDLFENAEGGVGGREVLEGLREYREGNGMAAMRYVGGVLKCLRNGKKDEEGVKRTRER